MGNVFGLRLHKLSEHDPVPKMQPLWILRNGDPWGAIGLVSDFRGPTTDSIKNQKIYIL